MVLTALEILVRLHCKLPAVDRSLQTYRKPAGFQD